MQNQSSVAAGSQASQALGWYMGSGGTPVMNSSGQSNGSSYIPTSSSASPAPNVPTTSNASSLSSNTNPLSIPTIPVGQNSNAFVSSLPGTGAYTQATNPDTGSSDTSNTGGNNWKNDFMQSYLGLTQQAGQEGNAFQDLNEQYQVPEQEQALSQLRGTIAQRTAGYLAQYQQASVNGGVQSFVTGEQTQIQRTSAVELGMLGAQEQALSGNLQASQDIVNQTIQHQFAPIQTQLSALQSFYTMNQNDLSSSESAQLQENYALQNANYSNLLSTSKDISNTLASQGLLTPEIATSLANATSVSGLWSAYSKAMGVSQGTNGIVNGYDLSTYATSPNTINNTEATSSLIGNITSSAQADKAISSIAPDSPITGSMIATASAQYGVDASTLIGVMNAETQLGTDKSTGAKTNNFGNVGNTDSAMAAGTPVTYKTPQDGVNAVASWLAQHKVSVGSVGQSTQAGTNPSQTSGRTLTQYNQLRTTAPSFISSSLGFVAQTGDVYMPAPASGDPQAIMKSNWAKANNVTILPQGVQPSDVGLIAAAMGGLDNLQTAWTGVAPETAGGNFANSIAGMLGVKQTSGKSNITGATGSAMKNYDSISQQAISSVGAVVGSSTLKPLIGNITTSLVPTLGSSFGGIFSGDTKQEGLDKISNMRTALNDAWAQMFPNSAGSQTSTQTTQSTSYTAQGKTYVIGSDGLYYPQ